MVYTLCSDALTNYPVLLDRRVLDVKGHDFLVFAGLELKAAAVQPAHAVVTGLDVLLDDGHDALQAAGVQCLMSREETNKQLFKMLVHCTVLKKKHGLNRERSPFSVATESVGFVHKNSERN